MMRSALPFWGEVYGQDMAADALDGNRLSVKVQKRHGFMKKERIGTSRGSRGFGVDGGGVVVAVFVVGGGSRLALRGGAGEGIARAGGCGLLFLHGGGGFLLGRYGTAERSLTGRLAAGARLLRVWSPRQGGCQPSGSDGREPVQDGGGWAQREGIACEERRRRGRALWSGSVIGIS